IELRQESEGFPGMLGLNRGRPRKSGHAMPEPEFIQKRGRKRRRQLERCDSWILPHFPVPAVGPWRQIIVVGIVTLPNPVAAEPVIGVEVVIDLDIELSAVI